MSLESFPSSHLDEDDRGKSLYDKVYSAATQIIHSFRIDEDSSKQSTPRQLSGNNSPTSRRPSISRKSSNSVNAPTVSLTQPPLPSQSSATSEHGSSSRVPRGIAVNNPPERPGLLRTSTTSSATVGVSSAQAVPMLPSTFPLPVPSDPGLDGGSNLQSSFSVNPDPSFSDSRKSSTSSVATKNEVTPPFPSPHRRPFDSESLFSVNSASASRAYLASQYSRTRSRAAPGRLGREFWMKDESATSCFNCNRAFSTFRRKHHCRVCGQIFCSTCTKLIDGERCGAPHRRVRCCNACEEALTTHSSSEDEGDLSFMSQTAEDIVRWPDLSHAGTEYFSQMSDQDELEGNATDYLMPKSRRGSSSDIYGESVFRDNESGNGEGYSRLGSPSAMDEIHYARSFLGSSHHHAHFSRPRSRSRSWSRSQSQPPREDDILITRPARSNSQGTSPGTALISQKSPAVASHPSQLNTSNLTTAVSGTAAVGGGNISTLTNAGYASGAHLHSIEDYPSSSAQFPNSASVELNNASLAYLQLFLDQLLRDSELEPEEWKPLLTAPLLEVAAGLHLEINDKLSPREWVKIKRIPGGTPQDIDTINGTVFTHSLARTSMAKQIETPRILLINFPIEYARNEKYMSLEPVVAQEKEYLQKLVDRIISLKPSVLLSSSHICGRAMDMLETAGVSVAQNVRESALFRLCRITKSDILMSIDRLSAAPLLGTCKLFEQRSYLSENTVKTFLFFFVGAQDPGRCALVRGDAEISGVIKVVFEVMAEICYSLKAETALMRDQFVMVPSLENPPEMILSSSPFVDYGVPYLLRESRLLEDKVVELGRDLEDVSGRDDQTRYVVHSRLEETRSRWVEVSHLWESLEVLYPFMFNPSSHQNLVVLYSLVCTENATPCIGPDAQLIEFYLNTDKTLGKFVESSIEQNSIPCPDGCQRVMRDHHRTYVNGNGKITIWTEKMPCKILGLEDSILMWSYCKVCEQQMPIAPMSSTTWKCSMGKYLELSFYGEPLRMRASTCPHNVYRDHVRYFGWHGYALRIEYSTVDLNEIYGPPKIVHWNPESEITQKHKAYEEWRIKLERFWESLIESLSQVKVEGLEDAIVELSKQRLAELNAKALSDRKESLHHLYQLNEETAPYDYLSLNRFLDLYQSLVDKWHADIADFDGQFFPSERDIRRVTAQHLRGLLGEDVQDKKSPRRSSFASIPSSADVSIQNVEVEPPQSSSNRYEDDVGTTESSANGGSSTEGSISSQFTTSMPVSASVPFGRMHLFSDRNQELNTANEESRGGLEAAKSVPQSDSQVADIMRKGANHNSVDPPESPTKNSESLLSADKSPGKSIAGSPSSVMVKSRYGNDINVLMPGLSQPALNDGSGRVAILARHFEELSREFERERQREKQRLEERQRAIRMRHAHPVAEVFEDVSEAIEDWPQQISHGPNNNGTQISKLKPKSDTQAESPRLTQDSPEDPATPLEQGEPISPSIQGGELTDNQPGSRSTKSMSGRAGVEPSQPSNTDILLPIPASSATVAEASGISLVNSSATTNEKEAEEFKKAEPVKLSLIRTLANFWAERSSTRWNGIEYVLGTHQHYFTNSPVVLRESEPSSLIAFCLSLPDYLSRVNEFYENTPGIPSGTRSLLKGDVFSGEQSGESKEATPDSTEASEGTKSVDGILEQAMLRQTGTHMRYHFDRNNLKVSCKIFFSEQFDALRRKCSVPSKYIQSLSRCSTWESAGGKSGSAFLKTLDDRLILKELSHAEFDSFVTFAPSYFEYMSQALFHDLPTVLAKMFGVYQITMRNIQTSQQIKMYVVVMENLFYNAKFSKYFDLKGSMRNRKVTETGKANEVLLDENMVEFIYETPVFVREHSKRMLRASLYNDTLFLTKMNVMDYSLVIGLDDEHNFIVAGIIDYIRTYTWDKKIESWVKTRAATVGVKEPTVVSPKQYKGRFRESMERYFVMVPDCWSHQSV